MTKPKPKTFYGWADNRAFPVEAQTVGETIADVEAEEGGCDPARLVELARAEASPLHALFEWRDGVAAEKFRVDQARFVIGSVRVVRVEVVGVKQNRVPAFVSVTQPGRESSDADADADTEQHGYFSLDRVKADAVLRQRAVMRDWAQIKGWLKRTEWIPEFEPLRRCIEGIEAQIDAIAEDRAA